MNKFNKGKLIGVVAASLSAVSLMGVGFASWIITGNDPVDAGNISVEVADVHDQRLVISGAKVDTSFNKVRFDADKTVKEGQFLTASDDADVQMSFKITYTVTNYNATQPFTISAYLTDTNGKYGLVTNNEHHLIVMPTNLGIGESEKKEAVKFTGKGNPIATDGTVNPASGSNGVYNVTQTFTFAWGTAFAEMNPSQVTSTNTVYDIATKTSKTASLEILKNNLKTLKDVALPQFKVTLVPSVTTTSGNLINLTLINRY